MADQTPDVPMVPGFAPAPEFAPPAPVAPLPTAAAETPPAFFPMRDPPPITPAPTADPKAKQKSAHIVTIVGGKPKNGIANSTSDDGVPIPRDGVLTIALIETRNPGTGTHPGTDIECVARLPDKSEIGDVVEAYCVPGLTGTSAYVHPPKGESIGILPVSTGDNVGTCIEVPATGGRRFRKTSVANWQVTGA